MKHAYVFPGQGAQFAGMGREHYENSSFAKRIFEQANEILGFRISDVMFDGSEEDGIILAAVAQYARAVAALVVSCHLGGDAP